MCFFPPALVDRDAPFGFGQPHHSLFRLAVYGSNAVSTFERLRAVVDAVISHAIKTLAKTSLTVTYAR